MALQTNDIIDGKYRIIRLLGEGGMGAVYEGENARIHRRVAIKVLHGGVAQSEDAVQRFEREAQAAGRIGSEHIVEVLDLGNLPSGDRYMVMEYLEGEPLSSRIAGRGRLAPPAIAGLAIELLEGLKAAHDAGIVHRDLKPDNVFLLASRGGRKDFVKIVDFGISKFNAMGGEFSMTRTGAVMGTPYYMAPEQAKGERTVDHRVDLYAVGVILYEAAAGEVPFNAETFNELLFKIVLENATPLTEKVPGIDPSFANIVARAMARNPAERYQTAAEIQADLKAWMSGQVIEPGMTAGVGTPVQAMDRTMLPDGAGPAQAAPKLPLGTHGAWANTSSGTGMSPIDAPPAAKRNLVIPAGIAVAVLGAAAAFFVTSMNSAAPVAPSSATAGAAEVSRAEAEAKAAREKQELALAAEKARLEAAKAQAEAAKAEAEKAKAEAARTKEEASQAARTAAAPAPVHQRTGVRRTTTSTATAAASTKAPAPTRSQTAPSTSTGSAGGRRIRTSL